MSFASGNITMRVHFLISNRYTSRIIQCVKGIGYARLVRTRDMEIDAGGLDVVVSQQFLYGAEVCALLQQVRGKGVSKHVDVYAMPYTCTVGGFFQHFHQRACRILLAGRFSLKQPFFRAVFPEIFPKFMQHFLRQQRVAAFLAFTHDAHQHTLTVDVRRGEVEQLTPAKPCGIYQ